MRDYLYFWHEPKDHFVVASGIHVKDFAFHMSNAGGLLLLSHKHEDSVRGNSGFDCVRGSEVKRLCEEDIYSWGDFRWIDYAHASFPEFTKEDVAEVLYFGHLGEPFSNITIPSLKNRFLVSGHDDGWFLKIYYAAWTDMADLLSQLNWVWSLDARAKILAGEKCAVWVDTDGMADEIATLDIDSILNRRVSMSRAS